MVASHVLHSHCENKCMLGHPLVKVFVGGWPLAIRPFMFTHALKSVFLPRSPPPPPPEGAVRWRNG